MLNKPIPVTQHILNEDTVHLVSIGCVTYNHGDFIRDAIEGFLMQKTTFPVKIVIFEDCSTDNTANVIRKYQSKYPYLFNVFIQSENTWGKPIRKSALEPYYKAHHKSKYIALCEGDDYWTDPLKLQKQVDFLEQNEDYGLVYSDIDKVDKNNVKLEEKSFSNGSMPICESFEDYLVNSPFLSPCTWLFRKSLIQKREKKYVVGDLPLLLDIVAHSKVYFLNHKTSNYRVLARSASHFSTIDQEYTFMKGMYEIQLDYAMKYNAHKDILEKIKTNYAIRSYNFAVAQSDIIQIKAADYLLRNQSKLPFKFKTVQFISKFKLGRILYRKIFNKRLGN